MTGIERFENYEKELREKHGTPGERIFTVSGLTGTGTSTIGNFLAGKYDLEMISAGEFFREEARKRDLSIEEFTRRKEKIEREEEVDFDLLWERRALKLAFTKDRMLFEGRLSGTLLYDIAEIRTLVTVDEEVAVERIAEREEISPERALKELKERDEELIKTFREKYQVDPRNQEYYNVIVDNSGSLEGTKQKLLRKIKERLEE